MKQKLTEMKGEIGNSTITAGDFNILLSIMDRTTRQEDQQELENVSTIKSNRASLVAQWLRVCLLMQGTRVRALVWEDPTCHGAAGPVSHNY